MRPANARFLPDPDAGREAMESLQRELADVARFEDDGCPTPEAVALESEPSLADRGEPTGDGPIVVGIDQAFQDEEGLSAAVAIQDGTVLEVSCGRTPLSIPYIPGLLAFREGGPIVEALGGLTVDPDLLVLDGHGRIHYREAGIATHVGVLYDVPAVGVAKNLLCGRPARSLDEPLPEGTRVPIYADESVTAPKGTVLGHAYQSRQYPNPAVRHVNPIYVSPGHRVGASTATDLVAALGTGYKLPAPTRLADRAAADCKG
jgi:deoxyribonuclease V